MVLGSIVQVSGPVTKLRLATGRTIWAAATAVMPVESPSAAWESQDGRYRPGDKVRARLGPAEVLRGPVPTPLGIVYRLKSDSSGNEYDEWEHNLGDIGYGRYAGVVTSKMLSYPEVGEVEGDGCSVAEDEDGVYVKTHRARSKSYPTFEDIPKKEVDFVATTASAKMSSDPDHSFVYYKGRVKLVEWSHTNRHRQILKELLAENGKELVDDIDDTDIVAGTVTGDKVDFEGFADPRLQEEAEAAIAKELGDSKAQPEKDGDAPNDNPQEININITIDGWSEK